MSKFDLYETVTDTIIAALEKGHAPWIKPWRSSGPHRNGSNGRAYNGINTLLLEIASLNRGFSSREWYTYKNAQKKGGQVRSGSTSEMVIFWQIVKNTDDKTFPVLRYYRVFNREQIDGLPEEIVETVPDFVPAERAEEFIRTTGADIVFGGERAAYIPSRDIITMPPPEAFVSPTAYYGTTFHELIHWTGHTSRLDRLNNVFIEKSSYAFEELIAELGSAFLCEINGVDGVLQHPEYIGSWLKHLRDDKKFIFSAASASRKAVEFLTNKEDVEEEEG